MNGCDKFDELLNAYLDKELSGKKERVVEEHLSDCPTCQQKSSVLIALKGTVKSKLQSVPAPAYLKERITSRIKAKEEARIPLLERIRDLFSLPRLSLAFAPALVLLIICGMLYYQLTPPSYIYFQADQEVELTLNHNPQLREKAIEMAKNCLRKHDKAIFGRFIYRGMIQTHIDHCPGCQQKIIELITSSYAGPMSTPGVDIGLS